MTDISNPDRRAGPGSGYNLCLGAMPRHDEASTRSAEGCPTNRVPRQEAAPDALVELEWPANAHIEAHATYIAAGEVDAFLGRDLLVDRPGATTFSLSVVPEKSGRLVARGLPPDEVRAGTPVLSAGSGAAAHWRDHVDRTLAAEAGESPRERVILIRIVEALRRRGQRIRRISRHGSMTGSRQRVRLRTASATRKNAGCRRASGSAFITSRAKISTTGPATRLAPAT